MSKTFKILVIEDNEPDFVLLKEALSRVEDIKLDVHCVTNGQDGINYVLKKGEYTEVLTPDLIFLDLNLPVKNGFEVLKCLKTDALYKMVPIIIYSTSDEPGDIFASYSLYANSYLTKTFSIIELFDKIKCFSNYWMDTVELPHKSSYCLIDKEKNENINY